jgi:hypothetical protein
MTSFCNNVRCSNDELCESSMSQLAYFESKSMENDEISNKTALKLIIITNASTTPAVKHA